MTRNCIKLFIKSLEPISNPKYWQDYLLGDSLPYCSNEENPASWPFSQPSSIFPPMHQTSRNKRQLLTSWLHRITSLSHPLSTVHHQRTASKVHLIWAPIYSLSLVIMQFPSYYDNFKSVRFPPFVTRPVVVSPQSQSTDHLHHTHKWFEPGSGERRRGHSTCWILFSGKIAMTWLLASFQENFIISI